MSFDEYDGVGQEEQVEETVDKLPDNVKNWSQNECMKYTHAHVKSDDDQHDLNEEDLPRTAEDASYCFSPTEFVDLEGSLVT